MGKAIEESHSGLLQVIEESLTDGSRVYNVKVGQTTLCCADKVAAYTMFGLIDNPCVVVDIQPS